MSEREFLKKSTQMMQCNNCKEETQHKGIELKDSNLGMECQRCYQVDYILIKEEDLKGKGSGLKGFVFSNSIRDVRFIVLNDIFIMSGSKKSEKGFKEGDDKD